nr:hypothetical protein [Tanacetum cinerariifolium]
MRQALTDRLMMVYTGVEGQFTLALGLHTTEEMARDRVVPSYTSIRDPLRRLCHRLIMVSISVGELRMIDMDKLVRLRICKRLRDTWAWVALDLERQQAAAAGAPKVVKDAYADEGGQALENVTAIDLIYLRRMDEGTTVNVPYLLSQYLFRHAEGRKRRARLSGGNFVRRLTKHFRLVTEKGLQGLIVVVGELRMIDMDKLVRLRICKRLRDTWAWVALDLERQQAAAAGAPKHKVVVIMAKDFSWTTGWVASGISQLLDATVATYTRYSETRVSYQRRRVRRRTRTLALQQPHLMRTSPTLDLSLLFF